MATAYGQSAVSRKLKIFTADGTEASFTDEDGNEDDL